MEARMTLCNMSIECGARAGMIAPDETTFAYLKGREYAPERRRVGHCRGATGASLPTDAGAIFDRTLSSMPPKLEPFVTWGTIARDVRTHQRARAQG